MQFFLRERFFYKHKKPYFWPPLWTSVILFLKKHSVLALFCIVIESAKYPPSTNTLSKGNLELILPTNFYAINCLIRFPSVDTSSSTSLIWTDLFPDTKLNYILPRKNMNLPYFIQFATHQWIQSTT